MRKEITALRALMKEKGIDVYLVTMDDDHQSEYVGAYYREIEALSGFTGSAGSLVVTMEETGLWTDGRYFVQAGKQLSGSGIQLMRMGEPETPELTAYIQEKLPEGGTLGFNGSCVSAGQALTLAEKAERKGAGILWDQDLPDLVWTGRPLPAATGCFILEERYAGKSAKDKLSELQEVLSACGASAIVITLLDDIAWLLNLRGDDVPHNPVFLSFFLMRGEEKRLYLSKSHLTEEVQAYLAALGVEAVTDPDQIYTDVRSLSGEVVLMERDKTNFALWQSLPKDAKRMDRMLPTSLMKAKKNPVEMENLREAHRRDGAALTRFLYWFKKQVKSGMLTEWQTVEKLHEFRAMDPHFIEESFSTIAAYGPNAAMCHYSPSKGSDTRIEPHGLYLVDSGGQYLEGTTDVTRTVACGPCTAEEKRDFTLSVAANLRLADARFLEGTVGVALDYIAREPFWTRGLNYNHGTGHGVGYLLNVHERPVGIRYRLVPERQDCCPLCEGMFVSDEPGLYIEGSHGVRTENMLMCVNDYRNEYGQFCRFETYTLCPMDREALDLSYLTDRDIALFNAYHERVYAELCAFMTEEERAWLREACAPISRQ